MKTTLKKVIKPEDKDWGILQNSVQSALDQLGSYQPKTPVNWASVPPQTLWDAIDRLAALAKTLNGGNPVP
jgi:hypothetical protein